MHRTVSLTINVEVETWECVRCAAQVSVQPTELRFELAPTRNGNGELVDGWRCSGWRYPDNWLQASWSSGERLQACPNCTPVVRDNLEKFAAGLRLR